jgi:hypothetical protein
MAVSAQGSCTCMIYSILFLFFNQRIYMASCKTTPKKSNFHHKSKPCPKLPILSEQILKCRCWGVSLRRHVKDTDSESHELGPKHAEGLHPPGRYVFARSRGVGGPCTELKPKARSWRSRTIGWAKEPKTKSQRPRTVGWTEVIVWASTRKSSFVM